MSPPAWFASKSSSPKATWETILASANTRAAGTACSANADFVNTTLWDFPAERVTITREGEHTIVARDGGVVRTVLIIAADVGADAVTFNASIGEGHQTAGLSDVLRGALDLRLGEHIDGCVHGGIAVESHIDLDDVPHATHV